MPKAEKVQESMQCSCAIDSTLIVNPGSKFRGGVKASPSTACYCQKWHMRQIIGKTSSMKILLLLILAIEKSIMKNISMICFFVDSNEKYI